MQGTLSVIIYKSFLCHIHLYVKGGSTTFSFTFPHHRQTKILYNTILDVLPYYAKVTFSRY